MKKALSLFAAVTPPALQGGGAYAVSPLPGCADAFLALASAARVTLAETASVQFQNGVKASLEPGMKLIAPGIGYACCPDHSLKIDLLALLPDMGVSLTESCSMIPEASVCGLVIAHRDAAYHDIRTVKASELQSYIKKRGFTPDQVSLFLSHLDVSD